MIELQVRLLNPHFGHLADNGFFIHKSHMAVDLLTVFIEKNLGRDAPDIKSWRLLPVFPDIYENDFSFAFICPLKSSK